MPAEALAAAAMEALAAMGWSRALAFAFSIAPKPCKRHISHVSKMGIGSHTIRRPFLRSANIMIDVGMSPVAGDCCYIAGQRFLSRRRRESMRDAAQCLYSTILIVRTPLDYYPGAADFFPRR